MTLFLAMAAVQFVLTDAQPASSYIMPTQQATLATYFLLALIALESIVVRGTAHLRIRHPACPGCSSNGAVSQTLGCRKGSGSDTCIKLRDGTRLRGRLRPAARFNCV